MRHTGTSVSNPAVIAAVETRSSMPLRQERVRPVVPVTSRSDVVEPTPSTSGKMRIGAR
jgi:hypothetical protein